MIDVFAENLIDFRAVARLRPLRNNKTGKPAGLASIYRYVLRGARAANGERVKLEVVRTPSGLRSSRRAVERFIRALSNLDTQLPAPRSSTSAKQIASAEAERKVAVFDL